MNSDVVVKKSKISGKGVFANRDFLKGEVVLRWNPKFITKSDAENLSENEKIYLGKSEDRYYLMQPPERFVNYSCDENTNVVDKCDVAIRNIQKGEDINRMFDEGNANQNWTALERLVSEENSRHKFWEAPEF